MTTQGERDPLPAGHQSDTPAAARRVRARGRSRIVLWCALAGVAAGGAWAVSRSDPGSLVPGLGRPSSKPAANVLAAGAPTQPLTEAQAFTAERYFPAQRGIDQDGYKARRTAASQGNDCGDTLQDRAHDVLRDTGCQGYLKLSFSRLDPQVLSSVTVLRFADDQTAAKAKQALEADPTVLAFVQPDGVTTTPPPGAKPLTAPRVDAVGHYLTVTVSRYADLRTSPVTDQSSLDDATRAVAYTARLPFVWL